MTIYGTDVIRNNINFTNILLSKLNDNYVLKSLD